MPSARKIALLAFYVALVSVSTVLLPLYVPATKGYFNVGEAAIYSIALLSGPYFGAVAGGLGSALADLALAPMFAPATLVIKGLEGGVLGFLGKKRPQLSRRRWTVFPLLVALVLFLGVFLIGSTFYTGLDPLFWGVVAAASGALIILAGFFSRSEAGWQVLSCLASGMIMVMGYFLYEQLLFGVGAAIAEVPINLAQVIVGIVVAVPAYRSLRALRQRTK